jgi:RNA polymerase sigma-70 factor (ECF subfamily)
VANSQGPLSQRLIERLGDARSDALGTLDTLEPRLRQALEEARRTWPGVALSAEAFVDHLAARVGAEGSGTALASLATADLYLAAAVCLGEAAAHRAFEARFFPLVGPALARLGPAGGVTAARGSANLDVDELQQVMRHRLFLGEPGRPPLLAEFTGKGPLSRWFQVVVTRTAISLLRRTRGEVALEDAVLAALDAADAQGEGPEAAYLRRNYQAEFKRALGEAVTLLDDRQRTLLRHHLIDRLTIDDIGGLYRVHRTTAFRWLQAAEAALLAQIRAVLSRQLRVGGAELESILRLLPGEDYSLLRLLDRPPQEPGSR